MNRRSLLTILMLLAAGLAAFFGERAPVLYEVMSYIEELLGTTEVAGLEGPAKLVRVTDGDTIVVRLDGQEEKLRLIGIDTPEKYNSEKLRRDAAESRLSAEEIKRLGQAASTYTEKLVRGKPLYLEFDATERDRYGRILAYIYVPDKGGNRVIDGQTFTQVNLAIVKGGWAEPLTIPPNVRYAETYLSASRRAKAQGLGMWGALP